ncbi:MAG: serine hydrolase domain-containing protein [Gemmatimonadales bacterium]
MRATVRLGALTALLAAGACGGRPAPTLAPASCQAACLWQDLVAGVDSAVTAGAAPGAVVAVSVRGQRFFHASGRLGVDLPRPVDRRTVYDLASLTKVVALTTVTMLAVDHGRLHLDDPVQRYLPEFVGDGKGAVTIRHLLTHSSGLRAHRPLWQESPTADSAVALALSTPLDTTPGARTIYSDLGAITLTKVIERIYAQSVDRLFDRMVRRPLGLRAAQFRPPTKWRNRIAPTERDPWRGRIVHGEVHDENAAFLGGISGHAGLFATADDLIAFGEWLLAARRGDPTNGPRLNSAVVREFTRRQGLVVGSSRALGWDTPSNGSSAGTRLSAESFGHTGFTGTSVWIDPTRDLVVILLTNRVNPTRDNPRLAPLRILVADRAVTALESGMR